jgi:hypothetical protein
VTIQGIHVDYGVLLEIGVLQHSELQTLCRERGCIERFDFHGVRFYARRSFGARTPVIAFAA